METDRNDPPYLWGDWRATENPDFFIAWCASCGADLWICWSAGAWRAACRAGCTREEIDAGAAALLADQRARYRYEAELRKIMEPDDPLYTFEATRYIEALTGTEPIKGVWFRCPFHADGHERTPSLHATDLMPGRWYCHSCHRGGTIYDFGALLWDIEPRREGFGEIRRRLIAALLAPSVARS